MTAYLEKIGKRFGKLTVEKFDGKVWKQYRKTRSLCYIYTVKCDCGTVKQIVGSNLSRTNSCGCAILARGRQSPHWKGHEEISSRHWSHIRSQAIERGYEFSISIEKGWDMFCNQNRKCAFTGRLIGFNSGTTAKYTRRTASLDRKDSSKGYVIDNVHWVHKDVNRMKGTLPLEEFVQICKEIARYTETGEQL